MVDALLLDALGTLVQLQPPAAALSARFGVPPVDAERAFAAEIAHYRANLDRGRDAPGLAALRAECAQVLWDALPEPPDADPLEALLACLHFDPYPEAAAALRRARTAGRRLVVVSNWDVSLHEVLERTGLGELLDGVVTSAEVGARKPAPEIFDRALALAGVRPERAVHVGDSASEDVEGARAAGVRAILVQRRNGAAHARLRGSAHAPTPAGPHATPPPKFATIADLSELEAVLAR